jgi:hypothetical protein
MDNEENQRQVSLVAHSPWKSQSAISTFPPPRRQVEKWKTNSRFPTFPLAVFSLNTKPTKEAWRRFASLPPSGSFFNEKMLK